MATKVSNMESFVYFLASKKHGTLYVGDTSNLIKRVYEHKEKILKGFSCKYNVSRLVYYEIFEDIHSAIHTEKCIKKWKREWKINLIEAQNPDWDDLYPGII